MAYRDFKDLSRRTASDNLLRDKAFNIAKKQNMMDIKEVLLLWLIKFLIKNAQVVMLIIKLSKINNCLKNCTNQLVKKFKKESFFFI